MSKNMAFNILDDDLTMRNYLALFACIINSKMTQSRATRLFELNVEGDSRKLNPMKPKKKVSKKTNICVNIDKVSKIKVLDITTNTYCEFNNIKNVKKLLGINKKQVKKYLESEELFLNQYKFLVG